jgi:methanogenic corrinoid protein MtbC1
MSSSAADGSTYESLSHSTPRYSDWDQTSPYDTAPSPLEAGHTPEKTLDLRLALLARAIEHDIIPRLMLAHRAPDPCLALPELSGQKVSPADVSEFAKLVLSRDEDLAQHCVDTLRIRGVAVETIYIDLLAPVARHLGELWEQDLCDITDVTVGLGRLQQVLRQLSREFGDDVRHAANGRRILLLPTPGEQHTFGLIMVAEFFQRAGWDVVGGSSDAALDPVVAVRKDWFDVVGFSMAADVHLTDLSQCVQQIRKATLNPHLVIIAGGPAFASNPAYADVVHADMAIGDGRLAPSEAEKLVVHKTARS